MSIELGLGGRLARVLGSLLPESCLACGATPAVAGLCAACRAGLRVSAEPCPVCGLPDTHGRVCGNCLRHPPAFESCLAAVAYRFPVPELVRAFKYGGRLSHAVLLVEAMRELPPPRGDLVLPMPLHEGRLRERGFNQAVEIARPLARSWGLPLALDAARRVRDTGHQAGRSRAERIAALRDAFRCDARVQGRRVVVVDDVMTTGASLDALARALRQAGAAQVVCRVFARTPLAD